LTLPFRTEPTALPEQEGHALMNSTLAPQLTVDGSQPLTLDTVKALNALCDTAEDGELRTPLVVAVSGAPATGPNVPLPLVNKWERALRRLEKLDVPTAALADCDCGGTALELLLATDLRIATPGSRLLPLAGDLLCTGNGAGAVWPGMALYRLANQAGVTAVRRAVLFGAPLDAERALALNLLDELAEDPAAALAALVDTLTAGPGLAIRRQLMLDAATTSFEEALGRHLAACDRVLRDTPAEVLA
jgi:isomerase DpgB